MNMYNTQNTYYWVIPGILKPPESILRGDLN